MPCQRVDCTKQDFNGMPESHYSKSLSADQMTFLKKKKIKQKYVVLTISLPQAVKFSG